MTIYYGLVACVGAISLITMNNKDKYKRNFIVISFVSLLIAILQGLRNISVGVDVKGYVYALKVSLNRNFFAGDKLFNYELGYSLYTQLLAKMGISQQLFLFIVAITIIIPCAYVWIKKSKMPGLSIFIYITLGFFKFSFSGLRQSIAIAIAFYSFKHIQNRKLLKFLFCILLASLFHKTAIIFIFAYAIYNLKIKSSYYTVIVPTLSILFLFRKPVFTQIYKIYKGFERTVPETGAYTMLVVMIAVLFLSYLFTDENAHNPDLNAYKNFLFVAIVVQLFANQYSLIMRAGYYYYIFITLLIPEVITKQTDKQTKIIATFVVIVALLLFFQVTMSSDHMNVSPYYFYWE